jgi:hypothetical protein
MVSGIRRLPYAEVEVCLPLVQAAQVLLFSSKTSQYLSSSGVLSGIDNMGLPRLSHLMVAVRVLVMVFLTNAIPHLASAGHRHTTTMTRGLPSAVEVIHQFPNNTWLENLAVRCNGKSSRTASPPCIPDGFNDRMLENEC